jgi:serine/threonine protein kinase
MEHLELMNVKIESEPWGRSQGERAASVGDFTPYHEPAGERSCSSVWSLVTHDSIQLDALDYIPHGLVYRDIKPDNILLKRPDS